MTLAYNEAVKLAGKREFRVSPVVYFLKRSGRIIYIGSTRCLSERVREHGYRHVDEVEFFHASSDEEARIAEKILIRLFLPCENVFIPGYGYMTDKREAPNCTIKRLFSIRLPFGQRKAAK